MGDHKQPTSPTSSISRARSLSGSIKNLFKSSNANDQASKIEHDTNNVAGVTLKQISDSKKKELSTSRGVPLKKLNVNLGSTNGIDEFLSSPATVKSPIVQPAAKKHVVASPISRSGASSPVHSRSSGETPVSRISSPTDKDKERKKSRDLEIAEAERIANKMGLSIETVLDDDTLGDQARSPKSSVSRNNSLHRIQSTPSYQTNSTQETVRRHHAGTVSASSLQKPHNDTKCILQVENFKVFKDGTHCHNLKLMPVVQNIASTDSDSDSAELPKQKSAFSLTNFFKGHRADGHNEAYESLLVEQLNNAVSLVPSMKELSPSCSKSKKHNKISSDRHSHDLAVTGVSDLNIGSSESDSDSDEFSDKVVNPCAAIGEEELKLITFLSNKIHDKMAGKQLKQTTSPTHKVPTFTEKYGKSVGVVLGHGAYGVVRLFSKDITPGSGVDSMTYSNGKKYFYAVKELTPKVNEPKEKFSTRITSEFIIGHSLGRCSKRKGGSKRSPNIVKVLDLLEIPNGSFIEVLEFCPSGDLYSLLTRKSKSGTALHPIEADCFMKQLLTAIQFMHSHGVAHCDLKPENILFHSNGLLKVCDFGTSCVFQTAWEKNVHFQAGAVGSEPYVAPEEFLHGNEYDPRLVDCWSIGVVYCSMVLGHYLWKIAVREKDSVYDSFCEEMDDTKEFYIFEEMKHVNHEINRLRKIALYKIFQRVPEKRISIDQLLQSYWMRNTHCCIDYRAYTKSKYR